MFHRLKAQATDEAQTRSTSRTSWRDKILLGTMTLVLGKMGWTACQQIINDTPNTATTTCKPRGMDEPLSAPAFTMDFASPDPLHVCYNAPLAIYTGCDSTTTVSGVVITRNYSGPCPGGAYTVSARTPTVFRSATEYTCDGYGNRVSS